MGDMYSETAERLWEKLEYYRNSLNLNCVNWGDMFPADQFTAANPEFTKLVKEVEQEYNYEMSEYQCSWAVNMFLRRNMEKYNAENSLELKPRP